MMTRTKEQITLEVVAGRGVRGHKSKRRSRDSDNWSRAHVNTGSPQSCRVKAGWVPVPCRKAGVGVGAQLLAQPSCTFSPFTLVRTSPSRVLPADPAGAEN